MYNLTQVVAMTLVDSTPYSRYVKIMKKLIGIYIMEEKIRFLLLNQETTLQLSDIYNLTPLLS